MILFSCKESKVSKNEEGINVKFITDTNAITQLADSGDVGEGMQLVDDHNAKNSLDWNGTYKGTFPADYSKGEEVTVTLNKDYTFSYLSRIERNRKIENREEKGKFSWVNGSVVKLEGVEEGMNLLFVAEERLFKLGEGGKRMPKKEEEKFVLSKQY